MKRSQRGVTLLEVITVSGLLLVFLGGLYLVLIAGKRHAAQVQVLNDVQHQARLGMNKIVRELENTKVECVNSSLSSDTVLFPSPDEPKPAMPGQWTVGAGTGLEWKKWVCFFHDLPGRTIRRTERPFITPNATPARPGTPLYPTFPAMRNQPQPEVLANHIVLLNFAVDSSLGGGDTVRVQVAAELPTATNKSTRIEMRSLIFPGNSDNL